MKEKHSPDEICPFCGSDPKISRYSTLSSPAFFLFLQVNISSEWLLVKVVFGITYIGMDLNLEMRVAIKEYYPNGCAVRNCSESNTVLSCSNSTQEVF